ncbi:hypothetical protein ES703_98313 [subsurface metagenome]
MKILVVTPFTSQHYDAGLFWIKALCKQGNSVLLWDYRTNPNPPMGYKNVDGTIVFKGEGIAPEILPKPKICYWPDALERTPGIEALLLEFNEVFTPVRPTPDWMEWMPSGWDPDIHKDLGLHRMVDTIYIGTANSAYKVNTVRKLNPIGLFGNLWEDQVGRGSPPIYLHEFVKVANKAKILLDVHQSPNVGLNRKLFELIACGFTIVDHVPGVEELFPEVWDNFTYSTPEQAKELIKHYLKREKARNDIWKQQRETIEPYTYHNLAWRMVQCLQSVE